MSESHTLLLSSEPTCTHGLLPVGGFLSLETHDLFRFGAYQLGKQRKRLLAVGRGPMCDIILSDRYVSEFHAIVQKTGLDTYRIVDQESSNGLFVLRAGTLERVQETSLTVGLCVVIGKTTLVTVSEDGRTLITAVTETEFRREALRIYGTTRAAGRAIGKSAETIRRAMNRWRGGRSSEGGS